MRRVAILAHYFSRPEAAANAADNAPIRADFYPDEALAAMARKIAAGQSGALPYFQPARIKSRLSENARHILHAFRASDAAARRHESISPATQWLIDNYYTIDKAVKQIRLSFPPSLMRRLPPYPGDKTLPRIFALAWFYIAHTDSSFSLAGLTGTIRAYQEIAPLTIGEIWLLPAVLRFILVENARRIADSIEHDAIMREAANRAADALILARQEKGAAGLEALLPHYNAEARDPRFAAHLLSRLENSSADTTQAIKWLHFKNAETAAGAGGAPAGENDREAANGLTMGNIIRAFKDIDDTDWAMWFESVCAVDFILRDHSDFPALDAPSRNAYRGAVEAIARGCALSETEVARKAVALIAADEADGQTAGESPAGEYLLGDKRPKLEAACGYRRSWHDYAREKMQQLGISCIAAPVCLAALIGLILVYHLSRLAGLGHGGAWLLTLAAALPAIDMAFALFNALAAWAVPPRQLAGYAFADGVPAAQRALVAVPTLITSKAGIDAQLRNLEVHYLSNPHGAVHFALVSDWKDSPQEQTAEDIALYDYARAQMAALNKRYPPAAGPAEGGGAAAKGQGGAKSAGTEAAPRFFFLHRRRLYNAAEGCFMGWERKRGKLHELNRLLRGAADTSFFPPDGPLPQNIRYVLTLDSDTRLTPGSVAKIIGKMSHPLNRPVIDPQTQTVRKGYALMQPRIVPSLAAGGDSSLLQRIFSGERGLDPYVFAVSDTYQDVLGEGSYIGKGLYEIDAFEAALAGRIGENRVLSHDLLEGSYARAAYVSDVEVVEDYPTSYYVDTARRHRWIRGDWQLLPFIFGPAGRGLDLSAKWKMLDNLRRSLMPAAWIIASLCGWCLFSFKGAAWWQIILLAAMYIGPIISLLRSAGAFNRDFLLRGHIRSIMLQLGGIGLHMLLRVSFIAYEAYYSLDAIIRSVYRMTVSHQHLLEWQSSDATKNLPKTDLLSAYMRMMAPAIFIALAAFIISWAGGGSGLYAGLPIMLLWFFSPAIAWGISRPATRRDALQLKPADNAALRRAARRDWAFYEEFVNEGSHFLPPDNFQEAPEPMLAHRTSPTNIGLYLLSTVAARDFGWISLSELAGRLGNTLATLDKLEKFRGHIYNWYKTDTLKPLEPLYISTVDSGNLAGHLVALATALNKLAAQGAAAYSAPLAGIADNVQILANSARLRPLPAGADAAAAKAALDRLKTELAALRQWAEGSSEAYARLEPAARETLLAEKTAAAERLAQAAEQLDKAAKSELSLLIARKAQNLLSACRAHSQDAAEAKQPNAALFTRLAKLGAKARKLAFAMQFGFLEHESRRLLSIGYRVNEKELDAGCYDLLASEARLAVLFAIAKGDVKHEYWGRLGRITVPVGWRGALLSWSGSMFEYLMPPLVMNEPRGSILWQTSALVVRRQRQYGAALHLPWGISEAAFNARDPQMNYQYSAFGVPSLGLQRGLSRNQVIAPYATLLAAQYDPAAAVANLHRLEELGGRGLYGYYDSLDFTPSRVPEGKSYAVVRNYYAHHHGMAILGALNATHNNLMRRRFHGDPAIEAAELLLEEKAPREIPVVNAKALNPLRAESGRAEQNSIRVIEQPLIRPRATQLLAGGSYAMMLTARGSGYASWSGMNITRYQTDAAEDSQGSFIFLRDAQTQRWWSATEEPTRVAGEEAKTIFTAEKAEFYKHIDGIESVVECMATVGGENRGEGEGRRVRLENRTNRDRLIEIISYGELALNDPAADAAHPVFSRMFVETEIADDGRTIFARRQQRSETEPSIHIAHFVAAGAGEILACSAETDRRAFIGRGRSIRRPAFFDRRHGAQPQNPNADGFTMDPVMSICCRIRIPAHKKAELVFWTFAAADKDKLIGNISHYRRPDAFDKEFSAVWTYSQIIRHQIGLSPKNISDYQAYAGHLLFPERLGQAPKSIARNLGRQGDLWPMAISGDFPICILRISNETELPIAREMLRAHEYWRSCGLIADLVILNERQFSYAQDTQRAIEWLCEAYRGRSRDKAGRLHIFTLRKDQLAENSYNTLLGAAHIVLSAGNGSLGEQLAHFETISRADKIETENFGAVSIGLIAHDTAGTGADGRAKTRAGGKAAAVLAAPAAGQMLRPARLRYDNGYGGFAEDGSYYIRLQGQQSTPHPWINIISNPHFGMHVSAGGAPFTWAGNSRDYQLTPWSNDPVSNRPGEALYLVDLASKRRFSPVSAVECHDEVIYETLHGLGWSKFASEHDGIACELTHTVDKEQPLRFSRLRLTNRGNGGRRLRLYNYVEWVLGNNRAKTAPFIIPAYDVRRAALYVRNPYSQTHSEDVSFVAANAVPSSFTADRKEFIGPTGTVKHPQAIRDGGALSGRAEAGGDACAALAYDISLNPGETKEFIFCLGHADNLDNARKLLDYARLADFEHILAAQQRDWADFTGGLQVKTPDDSFDLLVNHWLPYQAYGCRIMARAAFYQASGAFGLRDQLQDTLALLLLKPELARAQLAAAAGRQFPEGDLQHWWLPESGAGVRTTISDDVAWLAYGTALYVRHTGDKAFLDEEIPFIEGEKLKPGEQDAYFQPAVSPQKAGLYQHCASALNLAIARTGANGLPLMLGGDWNDGMNAVGAGGKGESVWLGWFLGHALQDFIPLAQARGDGANAKNWRAHLQKLTAALEAAGWDGGWYRRAYYDDGTPLGSKESDEDKIDTIAQSWGIISGLAPQERAEQAFAAMLEQLYDREAQLLRLFWPPFSRTGHNPGYIKAYPPGVRENGGQYTHGALWSIIAAAKLGKAEMAYELFSMANPIHHGARPDLYRVEPYVVAADIYSVAPRRGMGGWTWYSGSAGWLYRAATEAILGLDKRDGRLFLSPCLPKAWDKAPVEIKLRHKQAAYHITISRGGDKAARLTLDGKALPPAAGVPLSEDGAHEIELILAAETTPPAAAKKPGPAAKAAITKDTSAKDTGAEDMSAKAEAGADSAGAKDISAKSAGAKIARRTAAKAKAASAAEQKPAAPPAAAAAKTAETAPAEAAAG